MNQSKEQLLKDVLAQVKAIGKVQSQFLTK